MVSGAGAKALADITKMTSRTKAKDLIIIAGIFGLELDPRIGASIFGGTKDSASTAEVFSGQGPRTRSTLPAFLAWPGLRIHVVQGN